MEEQADIRSVTMLPAHLPARFCLSFQTALITKKAMKFNTIVCLVEVASPSMTYYCNLYEVPSTYVRYSIFWQKQFFSSR